MARHRRSSLTVTAEQARHALNFLVHEGKLTASEVRKAFDRREKLLREIRERMAELGAEGLELTARVAKSAGRRIRATRKAPRRTQKASPPARKRAKPKISAATRKLYQAQGRYMAALRQLSKAARAKVKAIRAKSGIHAAIREAKSRLAERRFITRQSGSPGESKNQKQIGQRQSRDSDQPRKNNARDRIYPARPDPKPDKRGSSGAGRQQGGSEVGRERG